MAFFSNINFLYKLTKKNISYYKKPRENCLYDTLSKDSIIWLGHATVLINVNNKIILTDPVFCNYLGYMKRLVKLPIDIKNLHIDYVLLSHGHTDHIHLPSLKKINKDAVVLTPKGYKHVLSLLGFKNIHRVLAGDVFSDEYIKITTLKAEHDGRRYYVGNNYASNSYLIEANNKKIFYAGDTAYTEEFNNLESDLALMPVGCYIPERFSVMHCSPEESFKMFKQMNSKIMLPIHYKTFILSLEDSKDTYNRLDKLNDGSIKVIDIGQRFNF